MFSTEMYDIDTLDGALPSKILSERSQHIISIPYRRFIEDIKSSFKNSQQLWMQFSKDLNRCRIVIDNCHVRDPEIIKDFLISHFGEERASLIAAHCGQVVMGLPTELLFDGNIHIGELSQDEGSRDLHITINLSDLSFYIQKKLRFFVIDNQEKPPNNSFGCTLAIVKVSLSYDGGDYVYMTIDKCDQKR